MEEKNGERERERERIGCGAEMPSCEQEPSVNLGRMKEKKRLLLHHTEHYSLTVQIFLLLP